MKSSFFRILKIYLRTSLTDVANQFVLPVGGLSSFPNQHQLNATETATASFCSFSPTRARPRGEVTLIVLERSRMLVVVVGIFLF